MIHHHHMKKKIPCSERKTSTRLHYVHNLTQSNFIFADFVHDYIQNIYFFEYLPTEYIG